MSKSGTKARAARPRWCSATSSRSPLCLPFALPVASVRATDFGIVAFLGVFQIGLAYVLLNYGLHSVGALEASLLLLAEPVLNPLWAWLVHGERPTTWALAGGAVIVVATLAHTLSSREA